MNSLETDSFFLGALGKCSALVSATDGRLFDTSRDMIDEDEDKIPYIIVSLDGVRNQQEGKDDELEGDYDVANVSVLVVSDSRSHLANLAKLARTSIKSEIADSDIANYEFSAGGVMFDQMKPCYYQTLSYQCEILNS